MKIGRAALGIAVAGGLAGGASVASATVLYTNGPINGTINAWTINFGFEVEDSFTLSTTATVAGIVFGGWTEPGEVITSVDWGIAATWGSFADDGTAAVTTGAYFGQDYGYDIYTYSFRITPTPLAAGTYYLTLQNAAATNGDPAYWDENDGPSTALENTVGSIGSESFSETSAAVLEPSTWAMMLLGFVGLGFVGGWRARAETQGKRHVKAVQASALRDRGLKSLSEHTRTPGRLVPRI